MKKALLWLALSGLAAAQPSYCNPLDIDYKYNFEQLPERISYRSGADPVIVPHKGSYYLFVTISGGWWKSRDLFHWTYVQPDKWPFEDMCAPAAVSVRNKLLLFQSTFAQRPILELRDPDRGKVEFFNRWLPMMKGADGPWDPSIFHDPDTDRWFMYFGSSNVFPLYGIELDAKQRLTYKGVPKGLILLDPEEHGWERFGQDHRGDIKPFTEGAWVTKHAGRYYLQYGAPGTEYNVYATGTYVGDNPLGPFRYASYNPVAYRPGGFACGTGHGNFFQDHRGRHWLTGTCWIGLNWGMERRIVMHPAGFDRDGQMFCDTRFGDFPHRSDGGFAGWMLLSHSKPMLASTTLSSEHPPSSASDENLRTFWSAADNRPGQSLTVDLGRSCLVRAVQVNYADDHSDVFDNGPNVYTSFKLLGSLDGSSWTTLADLSQEPRRDRACAYVPLVRPARVRYVRYVHQHVAAPRLSIADFRVFGVAPGKAPQPPSQAEARRDQDRRNAFVNWSRVAGATGYNVRWGIRPDKLHQCYQVWADHQGPLEIRALTKSQAYFFAVEAFNETGVSKLGPVLSVP
ncbi:family 43 glycosylhydrolase [bacterium]|nr:family 43 glycosylhydrolase [bacterium]